jgi:hypothetical protein
MAKPRIENPTISQRRVPEKEDGGLGIGDWVGRGVGGDEGDEGFKTEDSVVFVELEDEVNDVVVVEFEFVSRFTGVTYSKLDVEIPEAGEITSEEIVLRSVQRIKYCEVSVESSEDEVAARPVLLIKYSAIDAGGSRGRGREIVLELEAVLRLDDTLQLAACVSADRSSPIGVVCLILVCKTAGPKTGVEMFDVIGINLAATGTIP